MYKIQYLPEEFVWFIDSGRLMSDPIFDDNTISDNTTNLDALNSHSSNNHWSVLVFSIYVEYKGIILLRAYIIGIIDY